MPFATDTDRRMTDVFFVELADRLAAQEEQTRKLAASVRDLLAVPLAETVADTPRPRRRATDTVAATETPVSIPVPAARTPAPMPLLPDGFLLYDVIAAVPVPVVALDGEGRVRLWNPAAADLFGWQHVEVIGVPPPFVHADKLVEHQRMIAQAKAGVVVRETPTVRRTNNGDLIPVTATAAADASGGVVLTFRRSHPLAAPAVMVEQVALPEPPRTSQTRKLETLGRLLTAVAHDFNNVLAVVSGHGELLAERLTGVGPEQESVALIRAAAEHAQTLTRRLLGYAKPSDNAAVPVDLNDCVRGVARLVRGIAGAGVRVVIRTPRDAGLVLADPARIEQVVLNLVANAKDAMPEGGSIGVRTTSTVVRPGRPGWPADRKTGVYACLTVTDSGTGVDDVTRARMFDDFFTTKGPLGTGVGLATVRELVTAVRGHVECDSDPDFGTVFRVFLPAIPAAEPSASETVMLVDDDEPARTVARQALEGAGYDVIEAGNGDDAVRLARVVRGSIDVLVTDVVMPGMGGRKLTECVRALRPNLPVVFVSGYPQSPDRPPAGTAFVAKPYRTDELLAAVRRAVRSVAQAVTG